MVGHIFPQLADPVLGLREGLFAGDIVHNDCG